MFAVHRFLQRITPKGRRIGQCVCHAQKAGGAAGVFAVLKSCTSRRTPLPWIGQPVNPSAPNLISHPVNPPAPNGPVRAPTSCTRWTAGKAHPCKGRLQAVRARLNCGKPFYHARTQNPSYGLLDAFTGILTAHGPRDKTEKAATGRHNPRKKPNIDKLPSRICKKTSKNNEHYFRKSVFHFQDFPEFPSRNFFSGENFLPAQNPRTGPAASSGASPSSPCGRGGAPKQNPVTPARTRSETSSA